MLLARWGPRVWPEHKDWRDRPGPRAPGACEASLAFKAWPDQRDQRALLASPEPPAQPERQVWLDHRALKVRRDRREPLGRRDPQDQRDLLARSGPREQRDRPGWPEPQVRRARRVR